MGMMHGRGVYTYHTGDRYQGKFRKGFKCDKEGTFIYNNGDRYVGRFHNNVPYGRGRLWVHKTLVPKDVWNGVLVEVDPRPSQNGAFTNFDESEDIPVEYQDTSSQEGTSSSDGSSDADDDSSMPSHQSGASGLNAGAGSVGSQRSRYTISSQNDTFEHK
jgi:hypothetical protein